MSDSRFLNPGDTSVFERLSAEIAGNEVLRSLRQVVGATDLGVALAEFARGASSPTASLERYDEAVGKWRVLVNFLAKARRDHGEAVSGELERAFLNRGRLMPGERAAETEDWSLVAFDPGVTFGLIAFGLSGRYAELRKDPAMGVEGFPSLRTHTRRVIEQGAYFGWELAEAWRTDVLRPHLKRIGERSWYEDSTRLRLRSKQRSFQGGGRGGVPFSFTETEVSYSGSLFSDAPYLLLVRGDGEDVRDAYKHPRWRQRVAIWNFRTPKGLLPQDVGVHSASICRHCTWVRLRPSHSSLNITNGLGAVVIDSANVGFRDYVTGAIVPIDEGAEDRGHKLRLSFGQR